MSSFKLAIFALPLVVVLLQGGSCRASKMKDVSSEEIDSVTTGRWGGEHISMQVTDAGAEIGYDCAHGTIDGRMKLDSQGNFDLTGTHTPERGGPLRRDEKGASRPARYTGNTDGKTMTLTVTLTDTGETVGTFRLAYNAEPVLRKCH